jgi:hypothetical protein
MIHFVSLMVIKKATGQQSDTIAYFVYIYTRAEDFRTEG